jgi:hypothetical protein
MIHKTQTHKHMNTCIYTCIAPQEIVRELTVESAVKMMSTLSPEEAYDCKAQKHMHIHM